MLGSLRPGSRRCRPTPARAWPRAIHLGFGAGPHACIGMNLAQIDILNSPRWPNAFGASRSWSRGPDLGASRPRRRRSNFPAPSHPCTCTPVSRKARSSWKRPACRSARTWSNSTRATSTSSPFFLSAFSVDDGGAILRGRRRGLNALRAVARCADVRQLRAGIRRGTGRFAARALTFAASHVRLGLSPPQWHHQPDVAQRRPRLEPPPTGVGPRHEPDLRPFSVVLPGIELGTEIALNCGNADLGYSKQRESTRSDLPIRERC